MSKPVIRIRFVQDKVFYHLRNGLVRDRVMKFMGSMDINDLFIQIKRDGVKFSDSKIED